MTSNDTQNNLRMKKKGWGGGGGSSIMDTCLKMFLLYLGFAATLTVLSEELFSEKWWFYVTAPAEFSISG